MTMFYLVSLFLAGTVIALVLFGLAYWLYDRAPSGSRQETLQRHCRPRNEPRACSFVLLVGQFRPQVGE